MNKRRKIIYILIVFIMLNIFGVYIRYNQYILCWQVNNNISINGIKIMMRENQVRKLLGEKLEYERGFGGYKIEYPNRGIYLTFIEDADSDFHQKVSEIKIDSNKYQIYGVRIGDKLNEATKNFLKKRFIKQKDEFDEYQKRNIYIKIEKNNDVVQSIAIGIKDKVTSSRNY